MVDKKTSARPATATSFPKMQKPAPPPAKLPPKAPPKAAPKLVDRKAAPTGKGAPVKPPLKSNSKTVFRRVARPAPTPGGPNLLTRITAEPEKIGEWLYGRATWVDEIVAIILIVFGLVSVLALLNTTPGASLTNNWADLVRSIVGQVGGVILSGMILFAGLLIVLPKIGVRIPLNWRRFIYIEVAFIALLALLHVLSRDPEPRALARGGGGGGYIGWALGNLVQKPFGATFAAFFFGMIILGFLAATVGVQRAHVRQGLITTRGTLNATAERLTRERPPRPRRMRRRGPMAAPLDPPIPMMANPQVNAQSETALSASYEAAAEIVNAGSGSTPDSEPVPNREPATTSSRLMNNQPHALSNDSQVDSLSAGSARPPSRPSAQPDMTPRDSEKRPKPTMPDSLRGLSRPDKPIVPEKPSGSVLSRSEPTPAPAPIIEERKRRYFTVEEFKENRTPLERSADLPPMRLLTETELNRPTEQEINTNVRIIENTLLEFDIDVEVVDAKVGPTVTQYAVQPFREVVDETGRVTMQRVRVNKVASLSGDLALALSAKTLRIQPFVPGFSYMGIEVPNRRPSVVALRPVMESELFSRAFRTKDPDQPGQMIDRPLVVPLGRDVSGAAFVVDLATMPHTLIAGTTGSGKSVCITALIVSLIMNNHPDRVKLVLLDPKMVELSRFNGIPHLLGPVETELDRIIGVLRWATREMDKRYKLLEAEAARNIEAYNKVMARSHGEALPYIAIFIDEIGDLMLSRPEETERTITRLAQMARAVGMHLIVATQRPSVDIITGLIKANFPSRISFAVASGIDSRVILDSVGAETLMGRGDMLYQASDAAGPQRLQSCFVGDEEIDDVVNYWKRWSTEKKQIGEFAPVTVGPWEMGLTRRESHGKTEPLLEDAISLAARAGEINISTLQNKLGIDLRHATRLMDLLQDLGILGQTKADGRSREVTLKPGTDQYQKFMQRRN